MSGDHRLGWYECFAPLGPPLPPPFERDVRAALQRPARGNVSCSEWHIVDGKRMRHWLGMAQGFRWCFARSDYNRRFGELPAWTRILHPSIRTDLCEVARAHGRPLPARQPCAVVPSAATEVWALGDPRGLEAVRRWIDSMKPSPPAPPPSAVGPPRAADERHTAHAKPATQEKPPQRRRSRNSTEASNPQAKRSPR